MRRKKYLLTVAIWTGLCVGCEGNKGGSTTDAASEATAESTMADSTSDAEPTTGESGTTTGEPGTSTGPGDSPCEAFAENVTMCDPESGSAGELASECETEKMNAGPECTAAFDAYIGCFAGASCDDAGGCEQVYFDYVACVNVVSEVCEAYGAKAEECMLGPATEVGVFCQEQLNELESDPDCHDKYEAFLSCYSMLTCADIEMEAGCEEELNAFAPCAG